MVLKCHAGIRLTSILRRVVGSGTPIYAAVIDDDDKSKASFSYWGTGKNTSQKPVTKQRAASVYSGESYRLVSADSLAAKPILKEQPGPGGLGTVR